MIELESFLYTAFVCLTSIFLVIALLFTVFFVIIPLRIINSRKQEGVRTYFYPITGYFNISQKDFKEKGDIMADSKDRDPKLACKYIASHVNGTSLLVLQDTKYIKEFLQNPSHYKKSDTVDVFKLLLKTGLIFAEGDIWKRHRRIISASFSFDFLKLTIPLIQKTANEFFDKLSPEDFKSYNAIPKLQEITGETVGRIFFNEQLNNYIFEGKPLTIGLAELIVELGSFLNDPLFIFLGPRMLDMSFIPKCRKVTERINKMHQICLEIIKDRKANPSAKNNDMVSILLATQESQDKDQAFSDQEIVNEFITLFLAGMDTTGHLLAMALYSLNHHREYLSQLKIERDQTFNTTSQEQPLTMDILNKMELHHAVLKETLRIYTPVPVMLLREAIEDHDLLDIKVKKGELITNDVMVSAFSEKNFKDPKEFNPRRFIDDGHPKPDPFAVLPFGAGPRNCVGQHLALIEAKIILSQFLERFDFELEKGYQLRMAGNFLYEPEKDLIFHLKPKI